MLSLGAHLEAIQAERLLSSGVEAWAVGEGKEGFALLLARLIPPSEHQECSFVSHFSPLLSCSITEMGLFSWTEINWFFKWSHCGDRASLVPLACLGAVGSLLIQRLLQTLLCAEGLPKPFGNSLNFTPVSDVFS